MNFLAKMLESVKKSVKESAKAVSHSIPAIKPTINIPEKILFWKVSWKMLVVFLMLISVMLIAVIYLAYFHNPSSVPANLEGSGDKTLRNINVTLKWTHQSQFAGQYVAKDKGFYRNAGLDITLIPYDFKTSPIELVRTKKAVFGVAGADEIILARARGIPVKAIAVIYRSNPVCAFALKNSGIINPYDFQGKTVGIERGSNVEYEYVAMMKKLGINRSRINEISINYDASELLEGKVDVSTGYFINEPYYVISDNKEINIMMVEDYGVRMYGDVLFTMDDTIKTDPKLVYAFVSSTMDGWQYAIENYDETIDIVMNYAVNNSLDHERYSLEKTIPLILSGDMPLGVMDDESWNSVEQILLDQKLVDGPLRLSDIYTNDFITLYYSSKKCNSGHSC
jgi:NitT/TauT family transport system substrate-binding protein